MRGDQGQMVQIGALGEFTRRIEHKTIYHKNLRPRGLRLRRGGRPAAGRRHHRHATRPAAPAAPRPRRQPPSARPKHARGYRPAADDPWSLPGGYRVDWAGEGEWKITLDVFRDLGLAFAAAQVLIFVLLMFQTGSRLLPLVIMLAIPLSLIGVMPGFWLLNVLTNQTVGGYPDPGLPHGHGDDRHDCPVGHRGAELGRADRLHPPRPGRGALAPRGHHSERGHPHPAHPADRRHHALGKLGDYASTRSSPALAWAIIFGIPRLDCLHPASRARRLLAAIPRAAKQRGLRV